MLRQPEYAYAMTNHNKVKAISAKILELNLKDHLYNTIIFSWS